MHDQMDLKLIADNKFHALSSRNKPTTGQDLSRFQKGYLFCKLIQRPFLALALIPLSRDVELNPSFLNLDDINMTRGLKIAHFNIRSLRNKTDAICLDGINTKTIDVLKVRLHTAICRDDS